jgi:hypothetical protein
MMVMLSFLLPGPVSQKCNGRLDHHQISLPSIELALVSWARSVSRSSGMLSHASPSRRRR